MSPVVGDESECSVEIRRHAPSPAAQHVAVFVGRSVGSSHEHRAAPETVREREIQFEDVADHGDVVPVLQIVALAQLPETGVVVRAPELHRTVQTGKVHRLGRFERALGQERWALADDVLLGAADQEDLREIEVRDGPQLLFHLRGVAVRDDGDTRAGKVAQCGEDFRKLRAERRAAHRVVLLETRAVEPIDVCGDLRRIQAAALQDPFLDWLAAQVRIDDRGRDRDAVYHPAVLVGLGAKTIFACGVQGPDGVAVPAGDAGEGGDEGFDEALALLFDISAGSVKIQDCQFFDHCRDFLEACRNWLARASRFWHERRIQKEPRGRFFLFPN